jgi:fused signal recognition particle receptor
MVFNLFKRKQNLNNDTKLANDNQLANGNQLANDNQLTTDTKPNNDIKETNVVSGTVNPPNTVNPLGTVSAENSKPVSWAARLKSGLSKTRDSLSKKLLGVFGGGKIDEELYEELETILLSADVGHNATVALLKDVRNKVSLKGLKDSGELKNVLQECMVELLLPLEEPLVTDGHNPFVIMLVGVNGAGKTTSIGKLAKYFQDQGKSVMLAAGDTFRAAAKEQLIEWGRRNNVVVVSSRGNDSASVCYDAINSAIANKIDIVLADTAGRLPTQLNLMEEIKKVKRVITKALPHAPHEVLLVLDATTGQNAINQVKAFDDALKLTGLVLTKLDGSAKGGVICAITKERPVPIRFIGVGEGVDDLRPFAAREYIGALFD